MGRSFASTGADGGEVLGPRAGDQAASGDRRASGEGEVGAGVVVDDGVVDRPDERQVMGNLACSGEMFAELQAGDAGVDRFEFAPDVLGGLGLHVPEVLMRGLLQEEDDQGFCLRPIRLRGPEQLRQPEAEQRAGANSNEVAAGQAIAEATVPGGQTQHRPLRSLDRVRDGESDGKKPVETSLQGTRGKPNPQGLDPRRRSNRF